MPTLALIWLFLQKYYYWLHDYDQQVRRNFEIKGAKQLKNMFAYSRKSCKLLDFVSPNNLQPLQKYWKSLDFQKLSVQNKKSNNSDRQWVPPYTRVGPSQSLSGIVAW